MQRFENRIALVTGAASGIGRATAKRLVSEGATVVCADQNVAGAEDTAASLDGKGTAWLLDGADPASCERAVVDTLRLHGRIDVLGNIAGIGSVGRAAEIDDAAWQRVISVNLTGVFQMMRATLPHLIEGRGNIVNISSAAGLIGVPYGVAYSASKSGVIGLTKHLASYWGTQGVRVNTLTPGGVESGQNDTFKQRYGARVPLGRMARADEMVGAVLFLVSDAASYVTGQNIAVDGGLSAW